MEHSDSTERVHGVLDDRDLAALGVARESVVDFAVSTNPYGPCPAVVDAVRAVSLDRYPDAAARAARGALARMLSDDPNRILLGNGATELLWAAVRGLAAPGDRVVVAAPQFSEFGRACRATRLRVAEVRAEPPDFKLDLDVIGRRAVVDRATLVALDAPTSPVGVGVPAAAISRLSENLPDVTVVVDESFLSLSERHRDAAVTMPRNVVRVRSLTKDHALAGLRLGYAVGAPDLLDKMARTMPEWSVSQPAQAAAVALARETAFVSRSRRRLLDDRRRLQHQLRDLGLSPVGSTTPYFVVPVAAPAELRRRLLASHGVHVRDATSFGLKGYVRIAARGEPDCARLLAALRAEL